MLDICPNCKIPMIYESPNCKDHRCDLNRTVTATPPSDFRFPKKEVKQRAQRLTLDELSDIVVEFFDIPKEDLGLRRTATIIMARELFMYIAYMKLRYTQSEVASHLDCATSGVSMKVQLVHSELSTNLIRRKFFDEIMGLIEAHP